MPKIREDNLTEKETKAVEVLTRTGDRVQAIREAYPDTENPAVMAAEVFRRPRVKEATRLALERLNITPNKIISRFNKQASRGKNEAAKVRANENLAQLADLYPDKHLIDASDSEININVNY